MTGGHVVPPLQQLIANSESAGIAGPALGSHFYDALSYRQAIR